MSVLTLVLIVALVVLLIWDTWSKNRNWVSLYEVFGHQSKVIQEMYAYLKRNKIRCRIKNYSPGTVRMIGLQGAQTSTQSTIKLQVHKNDEEQAMKHLADFNQ